MQPNIELLKIAINKMSAQMGCDSLPDKESELLIDHVLYEANWKGIKGKRGMHSFEHNLITEREIRNLLMQHSRSKIARFNNKREYDLETPYSKEVCQSFEIALFGRLANSMGDEGLDYWQQKA